MTTPHGIRKQLTKYSHIDDFLSSLATCSNIIVISGAGISVPCGIPDFRSKGGIYNTIPFQEIGLPSPELLFDLNFFQMEPEPFYKYAKHLIPKDIQPSLSHYFIAYLESQQKLLRNYTQNFDGLEEIAGVTRYIQTHGSIQTFKCLKCRKKYELNSIIREEIENGHVPLCNSCHGILKPSIIFFGELLDNNLLKSLQNDCKKCDMIIVMGTSLSVGGPVIELLNQVSPRIPQILMNLRIVNPPKSISRGFDLSLIGECDVIVSYLSQYLQWDLSPKTNSTIESNTSESIVTIDDITDTGGDGDEGEVNSFKRRRRLPAYLMNNYGIFRDDDNNLNSSTSYIQSNETTLYKSSRRRRSMDIPPTPSPTPTSTPSSRRRSSSTSRAKESSITRNKKENSSSLIENMNDPLNHLNRELKGLYQIASNNFHDLSSLRRDQRRENLQKKKNQISSSSSAAASSSSFSSQPLNGISWKLENKRIYQFMKENHPS